MEMYITPSWSVPINVKAYVSTRLDGVSDAPYDSLNLGAHVGDDLIKVNENRRLFASAIAMPDSVIWLNQVHGTDIAVLPNDAFIDSADAAFTDQTNQVCAVLTADCLPVFFADAKGKSVAVAHAGWRSLCNGVLEETLKHFDEPERVIVWLGPAIGPESFEIGSEVREAFIAKQAAAEQAFVEKANGKWLGDLYQLAKLRLGACGVRQIFGGDFCTYQDNEHFFSYRREGKTGRMASVIWLE